ncbi:MAG: molybdenum cofactor guanylyltransferase [Ardenticatenaceae bacterium]|nr:molybdenum cofactor guanylyltransferase [Ardenticatenaceae bacterium]
MNQTEPISVAIMAGGKSSRMGTDKSFVLFNGRPLIEVVIEAVAGLGAETLLITNKPGAYAQFNLPMVSDVYPDHGSLGGIFTAVHAASHPHALIVACDMPWLNRSLLEYMVGLRETADIIVPRWEKYPEPLHAIYSKACLEPIEAKLKAQQLKITGFFGQVDVRFVERDEIERFDRNGRSFANINSPEDLEEAGGR